MQSLFVKGAASIRGWLLYNTLRYSCISSAMGCMTSGCRSVKPASNNSSDSGFDVFISVQVCMHVCITHYGLLLYFSSIAFSLVTFNPCREWPEYVWPIFAETPTVSLLQGSV